MVRHLQPTRPYLGLPSAVEAVGNEFPEVFLRLGIRVIELRSQASENDKRRGGGGGARVENYAVRMG